MMRRGTLCPHTCGGRAECRAGRDTFFRHRGDRLRVCRLVLRGVRSHDSGCREAPDSYAYVTIGELVAWVIGWALILEYGLGAATLSIYWTEYFNNLFPNLIPWQWRHSPLQTGPGGMHGIVNAPALLILLIMTLLLIKEYQNRPR